MHVEYIPVIMVQIIVDALVVMFSWWEWRVWPSGFSAMQFRDGQTFQKEYIASNMRIEE